MHISTFIPYTWFFDDDFNLETFIRWYIKLELYHSYPIPIMLTILAKMQAAVVEQFTKYFLLYSVLLYNVMMLDVDCVFV